MHFNDASICKTGMVYTGLNKMQMNKWISPTSDYLYIIWLSPVKNCVLRSESSNMARPDNPLRLFQLHPNLCRHHHCGLWLTFSSHNRWSWNLPKANFYWFLNQHKILLPCKESEANKDTIKDKLLLELSPQCQRSEEVSNQQFI